MARPRKQTYTLDMYLRENMEGDIDNKAEVQRNFAWKNEHINELIATILTDDYIPPIILGEEESSKLHIVDGGCRTAALIKFRYMNYKITSSIENPIITYKKKIRDKNGNISYADAEFDLKNKTYEKLPDELKKKFDTYQIETVIHEECDSNKISKYIKRYNNHVAMNTDQKAFTFIDKYASRIRTILDQRFFADCNVYSEADKNKGVVERIVVETLMCMNHFDNWKTQAKPAFKYLNDHATEEEFINFANHLHRLENIITEDIKDIFNKKDSFVFLTLYDRFTKIGVTDEKFADFLRKFKSNLRSSKRNDKGLLFDEIDKDLSTKDKQVITDKLVLLENMMLEFLHIKKKESCCNSFEAFIADNVEMDVEEVQADIDLYNDSLDALLEDTVRIDSKLRNKENRPSLLAMMAYSYKADKDLDQWMADFAKNNNTYLADQKNNFAYMKDCFEQWQRENGPKENKRSA